VVKINIIINGSRQRNCSLLLGFYKSSHAFSL